MLRFATASAVAALIAAPALAGSYSDPMPTPAPMAPVAMAPVVDWTGFYGGLTLGVGSSTTDFGPFELDYDHDTLGLFVGYRQDMGSYVLGGELAYEQVSVDGFDDLDRWGLSVHAGYDMGNVLPYVSLGLSRLEVLSDTETGLSVGIGADVMVSEKFTLGGEYRYTMYHDDYLGISGAEMDGGTFMLRAAYRF